MDVTKIPCEYKKAVPKDQRGTVTEISYCTKNYINLSRQLVTDQNISVDEAGRETVKSEAIIKKCNVYLPAGYNAACNTARYHVLYLLHGVGGDRNEWFCGNGKEDGTYVICNLLDNLIAKGDIKPMIVVFPDGRSSFDWTDYSFNSAGTNILGFYYFDYELRYDLIPFIESEYRTFANIKDRSRQGIAYNRLHRAIAGFSMGGMQSLNLILGGYRCDSVIFTGNENRWKNCLAPLLPAKGMLDLFAYVGAFSNAPTTSDGMILGNRIQTGDYKLHLLYMTCGDADEIAYDMGYKTAVSGLSKAAGNQLDSLYKVVIRNGVHDFKVWNNALYNYARFIFQDESLYGKEEYNVTLE